MVIIPTEKKFDWRHTPLVVFSIVLLNVLVFIVYQAGDSAKIEESLNSYHTLGYFDKEWPAYQNYLKANNRQDRLSQLERQVEQKANQQLMFELLSDIAFYDYLKINGRRIFTQEYYDSWRRPRSDINANMRSLSWLRGGVSRADFKILNLFTYQFLHGDTLHLLSNLFFLVVCGFAVEAALGYWKFLLGYLVCGVFAGAFQLLLLPETKPLIGASGAVSGIMALYLGIFRLRKIEFFYWIFFAVGYFRAPALFILPIYLLNELVFFIAEPNSGVAYAAHLGGFVSGGLIIAAFIYFRPQWINDNYVEQTPEVDQKQASLAAIYESIDQYQFTSALNHIDLMLKNYGESFELLALRYNLLCFAQDPRYSEVARTLTTMSKLQASELEKVENIWLVHGEDLNLRPDEQMNLALRLLQLEEPRTSAELFDALYKSNFQHALMGVLAKKLADAYDHMSMPERKKYYSSLSNELLEGGF